jgi:hypothetical protein
VNEIIKEMKDEVEHDVTEQIEKVTAPVKVRP